MFLLVHRFRSGMANSGILRSLEKEEQKIKAMHERAFVVRVANSRVDVGELVSSCQAIKDALDTFYVSYSDMFMFLVFPNYGFIDLSPGWAHSISGKEHTRYSEGVLSHL